MILEFVPLPMSRIIPSNINPTSRSQVLPDSAGFSGLTNAVRPFSITSVITLVRVSARPTTSLTPDPDSTVSPLFVFCGKLSG